WSSVALAQGAPNEYQIGFPLNGEFSGTNFEQVQMNNGNLHIEIPLWSAAGRGPLVGFKYVYDSLGWGFNETCDRLSGTCHDVVTFHPSKAGLAANHLALGIVGPQSFTFRTVQQNYSCSGTNVVVHSFSMATPDGTHHH